MKIVSILLNLSVLIISLVWLIKSEFDYEPLISTIVSSLTFIGIFYEQQAFNSNGSENNRSNQLQLILIITILVGILIFCILHFNTNSTIGIKGNNNDNNKIQIK
ncbi:MULTISPECIES: hypothetical protein [unclassified Chryseobacterium]|uniref:hypothetical protein n=1 Tax=unclassified Chryseobacterium TaxID=2593645 RepID=UPI00301649C5